MDLIIPTSQPSKTNTKSSMVSLSFMPPKNRASIFKGLQHQNCQKTRSKPNTKIFNYNIEYKTKHFFILSLKNTLSNWKRSIQWLPTPPKKNTNFDQFTTHPPRNLYIKTKITEKTQQSARSHKIGHKTIRVCLCVIVKCIIKVKKEWKFDLWQWNWWVSGWGCRCSLR